jgi:hypothetical protein
VDIEYTEDPEDLRETFEYILTKMPTASKVDAYLHAITNNEATVPDLLMLIALFYVRLRSIYPQDEMEPVINTALSLGETLTHMEIMLDPSDNTRFAPITAEKMESAGDLAQISPDEIDWDDFLRNIGG